MVQSAMLLPASATVVLGGWAPHAKCLAQVTCTVWTVLMSVSAKMELGVTKRQVIVRVPRVGWELSVTRCAPMGRTDPTANCLACVVMVPRVTTSMGHVPVQMDGRGNHAVSHAQAVTMVTIVRQSALARTMPRAIT